MWIAVGEGDFETWNTGRDVGYKNWAKSEICILHVKQIHFK